jgi:DNA processing protein
MDCTSSLDSKLAVRPISPFLELGAYEALWNRKGTTFKSIAELFRTKENATPSSFVSQDEAESFAKKTLELLEKNGVKKFGVRIHSEKEYPQKLRDAWNPIEMMYYQGCWDFVSCPKLVAVVGTRNPSDEGVLRTKKLVKLLVKEGYGIVSGLAKGIDTVAHETAIESDGLTIAVIGTPLNHAYPKENVQLQHKIANNFLLISQIPVYRYSNQTFKGNRLFFPERNITMSALTSATIIVEAGETSGTLTQARAALAQKRKLFILDNCFRNPNLTWPRRFEKEGAIRVREIDDIKENLGSSEIIED